MKATDQILCPTCAKGHLIPQTTNYPTTLPDGQKIVVPGVELEICNVCGESTISLESSLKVEAYVAEQIEQLSTEELSSIRRILNVDQTEMSVTLGLGTKTYHRWEKGNQIPSRSMGYYLRVLAEFPDAFAWLRARSWRKKNNVIQVDFQKAFPALSKLDQANVPRSPSHNPAMALFSCRAL